MELPPYVILLKLTRDLIGDFVKKTDFTFVYIFEKCYQFEV